MLVNAILGLTIALLPLFIRVTFDNFERTAKNNLLFLILVAIMPLMSFKRRRLPVELVFAFIIFIIGLMFNHDKVYFIYTIIHSFYISMGIVFFWKYYETHQSKHNYIIINGLIAGCLIQCFFAIPSYFEKQWYLEIVQWVVGSKVYFTTSTPWAIGSLLSSNFLSSYLALSSLALLYYKKTKWLLPMPIIALIMSKSLMGIGSFAAGLAYYFIVNRQLKPFAYVGVIISMAISYFFGMSGFDSGRFSIWKESISKVDLWHLLIGKGPGWFQMQGIKVFDGTVAMEEHNEFLSFFNIFGLIGILLILPTFWKFLRSEDNNKVFASILFAAFCNAYGHFNLHQSTTAIIIIVTLVICLANLKDSHVVNMER